MWVQKGTRRSGPNLGGETDVKRATEYRISLFLCLVDLTEAYDSVNCQTMVAILKEYGVPHQLVAIIEELHLVPGEICRRHIIKV